MFDIDGLSEHFQNSPLENISDALIDSSLSVMNRRRHGDLDRWMAVIRALPTATPSCIELDRPVVTIGDAGDMSGDDLQRLRYLLLELCPWRKGPFDLFGAGIDSEWRSDLKWGRLENCIRPLKNKLVMDVGCGNGYYMLRSLGAGAKYVLGVDPTQLFIAQFNAITNYFPEVNGTILPLRCEEFPFHRTEHEGFGFDTVFSMGILYHRKDPIAHLMELSRLLKPGGELVIESLIICGDSQDMLVPESTYAKMRNVWCIPSESTLHTMLGNAGFEEVVTVDISTTTVNEQRQTQWMQLQSLSDFLDPKDRTRTVEGYPAPTRIVVTCSR